MDPMSALSVAAAVIQFVDFGRHLLSDLYEIYRSPSGETVKMVDVSTIANDLACFTAQIKDKTGTSVGGNRQSAAAEYHLIEISEECEKIVTQFQSALDQLRRGGTGGKTPLTRLKMARGAIRKALSSVWNDEKINGMIERLEKIKARLVTATLVCLWYESKKSAQRDIQFSEKLNDMIALLKRLDGHEDKIEQQAMDVAQSGLYLDSMLNSESRSATHVVTDALNDGRSPQAILIQEELVACLWNQQQVPGRRDWMEGESDDEIRTSETMQTSFRRAIIDSLIFETIQGREEAIPNAFEKTFPWIFQREPTELDGKHLWSSFPEWLENDTHQPYWITGKPGSGKSTLMKFIFQQPLLQPHLQKWANNFDLLITRYYAWVAGSDLQKSREGLMRTLLYQALQLNPLLVPEVTPRRWSLFVTLRSVAKMPAWQEWEIEESFELLLAKCGGSMRLALFIDGLDEFEAPPFKVLELIHHINAREGIKVCVASRQWTEFNDAFHENPMLRMQDLTTADMAHFVEFKFEVNRGFLELKKIFPTEASQLIDDVVKKADGVFLWVALVAKALLEALTEGDGLIELQATLNQLPSDIAQLYDAIWSRISSRNISAASKLLVTYRAATGPVDHVTLWLADEKQSLDFDISFISADKLARSGIVDIMKRRLDSKTRGILEISSNGTVNFLHRTARDWTLQSSVWETICSTLPDNFDPYLLLLKAETIRLPNISNVFPESTQGSEANIPRLWADIHRSLWYASQVEDSPVNTPELIRILNKLDREVGKVGGPQPHLLLPEWHSHQKGDQLRLHWSRTQPLSPEGRSNTFLGLLAQFCVLPYLQTELLSDPNAAKSKASESCVSLLENAVFGCPGVTDPRNSDSFHISLSQRLKTVDLLLERGASPKQVMRHGVVIIFQVRVERNKKIGMPSLKDYWIQVEQLMDKKLGSKGTLKSIFGWKKGEQV